MASVDPVVFRDKMSWQRPRDTYTVYCRKVGNRIYVPNFHKSVPERGTKVFLGGLPYYVIGTEALTDVFIFHIVESGTL